ncbi:hypothetical protein VCSRO199_2259 [Vibrio cholerae]|nr:hypothetical protein VCSRO199_2259 [Vibrio cholerae]
MSNDEEQVTQLVDKLIDRYVMNHSTTQINDLIIIYLGD